MQNGQEREYAYKDFVEDSALAKNLEENPFFEIVFILGITTAALSRISSFSPNVRRLVLLTGLATSAVSLAGRIRTNDFIRQRELEGRLFGIFPSFDNWG